MRHPQGRSVSGEIPKGLDAAGPPLPSFPPSRRGRTLRPAMSWDALLPPALVLLGAGSLAAGVRLALAGFRLLAARPRWLVGAATAGLLAGVGVALVLYGLGPRTGGVGHELLALVVALVLAGGFAAAVADARRWRRPDRHVDAHAHWRRAVRLR